MGIYSTRIVSRAFAIGTIIEKTVKAENKMLEDLLFQAIGEETLNNFIVVDTEEEVKRRETDG